MVWCSNSCANEDKGEIEASLSMNWKYCNCSFRCALISHHCLKHPRIASHVITLWFTHTVLHLFRFCTWDWADRWSELGNVKNAFTPWIWKGACRLCWNTRCSSGNGAEICVCSQGVFLLSQPLLVGSWPWQCKNITSNTAYLGQGHRCLPM